MDPMLLKKYAFALREKLEEYIEDGEIAELAAELNPIIDQAIAGEIVEPMAWDDVPGEVMYEEGQLADFDGLEEAYADFTIELTGEADSDDEDEDEED